MLFTCLVSLNSLFGPYFCLKPIIFIIISSIEFSLVLTKWKTFDWWSLVARVRKTLNKTMHSTLQHQFTHNGEWFQKHTRFQRHHLSTVVCLCWNFRFVYRRNWNCLTNAARNFINNTNDLSIRTHNWKKTSSKYISFPRYFTSFTNSNIVFCVGFDQSPVFVCLYQIFFPVCLFAEIYFGDSVLDIFLLRSASVSCVQLRVLFHTTTSSCVDKTKKTTIKTNRPLRGRANNTHVPARSVNVPPNNSPDEEMCEPFVFESAWKLK